MCLSFQIKVQKGFQNLFEKWADIVVRRTCIVFWVSFVIIIALSSGMSQAALYEDENDLWTPAGNPSIVNREKSQELFPVEENIRFISVLFEAKDDNIITVDALKEMVRFQDSVLFKAFESSDTTLNDANEIVRTNSGAQFRFEDVCKSIVFTREGKDDVTKCITSPSPLDFVYSVDENRYLLDSGDAFDTDAKLVEKIQKGRGDKRIYPGPRDFIYVPGMVGQSTPANVEQVVFPDPKNPQALLGANDLVGAKAIKFGYVIDVNRNPDIDEDAYFGFEEKIHELFEEYEKSQVHMNAHLFTFQGLREAFVEDINNDFTLIFMAIIIVVIYTVLVLGSFSPVHCRCLVSCMGILCILLSYTAGFGLLYYLGRETTGVHQLMPFLLVGIGADDMFVMCNAVDQTDYKKSAAERIKHALSEAGPAITITSLTNCLAFAFGATSSLIALKSFCGFASMAILMLYLTVMTIFLSMVVWDTRRISAKKGECCGLCTACCSETSIICCGGACTSPKQKEWSGVEISEKQIAKMKADEEKYDLATRVTLQASGTERCIGKCFAPCILSTVGRIVCLVLYVAWTAIACWGASEVVIFFDIEFFVSEESAIFPYYQKDDIYFSAGIPDSQTFVDIKDLDVRDIQEDINAFNTALQDCTDCEQKWHKQQSLQSWYPDFQQWTQLTPSRCTVYDRVGDQIDTVPREVFYPCLVEFLRTDKGKVVAPTLLLEGTKNKSGQWTEITGIKGWKQTISLEELDAASDGPTYLTDIRAIESKYGFGDIYSYSDSMLEFEGYVVFVKETCLSVGLAVVAVFLVVLFITGSLPITILVVLAVLLVDLYLLGLVHLWDLTMNNIVVVQLVIGLGLAVDYSAHIAHTYLTVVAPPEYSNREKRMYKARVALSQMGSSVIHGGISTFLAIVVLGGAKSYIFVVFFRIWVGIIVFGMCNGFILLPIILSFIGPTTDPVEQKNELERRNSVNLSKTDQSQLADLQKKHGATPKDADIDEEVPNKK